MKPEPLTPLRIRAIMPPTTGRAEIADGATPGLCLRVSARDSWKWTLRMRGPEGGLRRFVLGEFTSEQGLAWARRKAERLRQQVRHEGHDPHRERKERARVAEAQALRERLTFEALVEHWRDHRLRLRRPRYAAEAVRALRVAFAEQWKRPAEDLAPPEVARVLAERAGFLPLGIKEGGQSATRRAMAGRTAAYGRACFGWAIKHHLVQTNPFATVPFDELRVAARDRVLTDRELAAVWHAAATGSYGHLVRLLILTGQRREEAAGIAWPELSEDRTLWTIPAARTKNGKVHLVPLSSLARELLPTEPPAAEKVTELVFPGQRVTSFSGWSKCKAQLDQEAGVSDWRIHDLRRTLATGLQRLGVRLEVTEAVLNHVSGSRVGIVGVYQRHDWAAEKRSALDAWAEHVRQIIATHAPVVRSSSASEVTSPSEVGRPVR